MTAFALTAALLAALALAWILPGLLRHRRAASAASVNANLAVLRDQLTELERDLANSTISAQQYDESRRELERRALEESRGVERQTAPSTGSATRTAIALGVALPVGAALLYWQLGNPAAIFAPARDGAAAVTPQQIEQMVSDLAARLEKAPDDAAGWALLGRSYFALQRYPQSAAAYARAAALQQDNASLLADYADALAMSQGRRIDGPVIAILERALELDPQQWKALAMAASAAFERKQYEKAAGYWETLRARAPAESEFARLLEANIAEARALGGIESSAAVPPAGASVRGTVSLSPGLAGKADPSDTVFVFARAADGPRQPLAIIRRQVKDLPLEFALDDSQAMTPQAKLSHFADVVISARVSKAAQAAPQSGDLQGASGKVKVGASGVAVVIDSVVP